MRCRKWLELKEKCLKTKPETKENREAVDKFVQHCRTCYICQDHYSYLIAIMCGSKQKEGEE